jgi:starvation-inducible DNA-binding protein
MTIHHSSHVTLADDVKSALIETLNASLATAVDLTFQVEQAHWNIKGPSFFTRHELFDNLADHLPRVDRRRRRARQHPRRLLP